MKLTTLLLLFMLTMTPALAFSDSLSGLNASEIDSVVLRQCEVDAIKADQYDVLRNDCAAVERERDGFEAVVAALNPRIDMLERALAGKEAELQVAAASRPSRWVWFGAGVATALLGVLVAVLVF